MDIKDLDYEELLSNQGLEIDGGVAASLIDKRDDTVVIDVLDLEEIKSTVVIGITNSAGHCGWIQKKPRPCPHDLNVALDVALDVSLDVSLE